MKIELTKDGIKLRAQCRADDEQLQLLWEREHLHLVCKARQLPSRRFGCKLRRGTLLLTTSVLRFVPLGKAHGTGDARREPA